MVTIKDIIHIRSFCEIILDSGDTYWLKNNDLPSSGFQTGDLYEYDFFLQQIRLFQYPRALNHAVSMLARRPCSKKEIYCRLIRLKYCEDVAGLVICKLEKEQLINDADFCMQWIQFRRSGHTGPSVIRQELKHKGIPEYLINSAFSDFIPEEIESSALILARKLWRKHDSDEDIRKIRQKVIVSLVRKGYDWDTAHAACDTAEAEK